MNKTISKILVMLALACLLAGADAGGDSKGPPKGALTDKDPAAYKGMTPDQIASLKRGEIIILEKPENVGGKQMIAVACIFDKDIDTTWNLLNQGWRNEEFTPNLTTTLVEKREDGITVQASTELIGFTLKWREIITFHENYRRTNRLDPDYDNSFKELTGVWHLYWVDDKHTLGRYKTRMEISSWVPDAAINYLTRNNLPESVKVQKIWIDSGGTYRKPGYEPKKKEDQ